MTLKLKCPYALFWLITLIRSCINGFMTENRLYDYIQGQGHLGYMDSPRDSTQIYWGGGGNFFVRIVISLQVSELWPKLGF